jgi:hypothetical protein
MATWAKPSNAHAGLGIPHSVQEETLWAQSPKPPAQIAPSVPYSVRDPPRLSEATAKGRSVGAQPKATT